MLDNSEKLVPSDMTFTVASKNNLDSLMQDSFQIANFANTVDPTAAELLMVGIGTKLVKNFTSSFQTSLSLPFMEFECRRLTSCNLGTQKYAFNFCDLLLSNIREKLRPEIITGQTTTFTEVLKRALDKPFKSKYFSEDLNRAKEQDLCSLYKALNGVYSTVEDTLVGRAHKLALVCKIAENLHMDRNEKLNALLNSIHNFHVLTSEVSMKSIKIVLNSVFLTNDLCRYLAVDTYYFAIIQFYKLITEEKVYRIEAHFNIFKDPTLRFSLLLIQTALSNFEVILKRHTKVTVEALPLFENHNSFKYYFEDYNAHNEKITTTIKRYINNLEGIYNSLKQRIEQKNHSC